MDKKIARKFDSFVVLTNEDREYWSEIPNMTSIGNAALPIPQKSDSKGKRVIAVGRLDYQKGFDRLINIWGLVKKSPLSVGWRLDIFGQGEHCEQLEKLIIEKELSQSVCINPPTKDIPSEYSKSSILAMTSRYEGFPMVMVEAMSAGLPVVTFDYKCGPRDIVNHGVNGYIIKEDDIHGFAEALLELMGNSDLRFELGRNAIQVEERYSEAKVMNRWTELFDELLSE